MTDRRRESAAFAVLILLAAVLTLLSLACGAYPLTLSEIGEILRHPGRESVGALVFFRLRVPRTIMAILAGAMLSLCGGIFQTIFRTPLASPDLTGVASGASFGAACAIVLGTGNGVLLTGSAFLGGMLSLGLVLLLVRASGGERTGAYLLGGVIVSAVTDAGLMILKTLADPEGELAALEFWTMGSLAGVTVDKLIPVMAAVVPVIVLLLLSCRPILLLSMSEEDVRAAGLSPRVWRTLLLIVCTLGVSAVVCVCGVVSFLGLIAPHIARFLYGRRSGGYLPLCALSGSVLLLAADLPARMLAVGAELPLSIFTVLFSAPILAVLLIRRREATP